MRRVQEQKGLRALGRRTAHDAGPDDVARRISAPGEDGQLEAQGDLSMWRTAR